MKEVTLRIFSFWIMSWYILESVFLILSYIMNWGVFIPLIDEEFPSILSKIIIIFMSLVPLIWDDTIEFQSAKCLDCGKEIDESEYKLQMISK